MSTRFECSFYQEIVLDSKSNLVILSKYYQIYKICILQLMFFSYSLGYINVYHLNFLFLLFAFGNLCHLARVCGQQFLWQLSLSLRLQSLSNYAQYATHIRCWFSLHIFCLRIAFTFLQYSHFSPFPRMCAVLRPASCDSALSMLYYLRIISAFQFGPKSNLLRLPQRNLLIFCFCCIIKVFLWVFFIRQILPKANMVSVE